jgi:hypothetical protein
VARVELPDGQWAELKDADDLTGEDEVKVRAAVKLTGAGSSQDDSGDKADGFTATAAGTTLMEYMMLARVITSWSLPQPINAINIRALRLSQLRPLKAAIRDHMEALRDDPNSPSGSGTA